MCLFSKILKNLTFFTLYLSWTFSQIPPQSWQASCSSVSFDDSFATPGSLAGPILSNWARNAANFDGLVSQSDTENYRKCKISFSVPKEATLNPEMLINVSYCNPGTMCVRKSPNLFVCRALSKIEVFRLRWLPLKLISSNSNNIFNNFENDIG